MPFRSLAQRRFMFARHPEIAKRWSREYGTGSDLPERAPALAEALRRKRRRKRTKA